jgi:Peptidase family S41
MVSKKQPNAAGSPVKGAEPYQPKLTKTEVLNEIDRVSGPSASLRECRAALPTGHVRKTAIVSGDAARAAQARSVAEAVLAGAPVAEAAALPPPPAAAPPDLSEDDRRLLIDQALLMLEEVYAHLPLKRALHAIDPVQRLRLLRLHQDALDERAFQSEMIDIFVSLRDLHTNYTLPSAYWPKFAFLPFRIEEFYEAEERKYLVSWVSPKNTDPKLIAGVEIGHWNGSPIDIAVARNAAREAGSNLEARRARGLEALTLRWLGASLPPDEDWVQLTYPDGTESRVHWHVVERNDLVELLATTAEAGSQGAALGLDIKTELLRRVRKALFDAPALKAESEMQKYREGRIDVAPAALEVASLMPDVYPRFGRVNTPSGSFGYIRLATFAPPSGLIDAAVGEFVRILKTIPPTGLILDVRGNGGGYVNFGERILQTLTPRPITPEPFHFVTTALTMRITRAVPWLNAWGKSLETALATGSSFSQGFPLTTAEACNDIGQVYQGPVVLVTDAFCYSTTDIFAAGFQDHHIGKILGCHANTGAGGANVWDQSLLVQLLGSQANPFSKLPAGAGMRVAARRSMRVGEQSGVPLEDLGVVPDARYYMSRRDLLEHNVDLIARAAELLKEMGPVPSLKLEPIGPAPVAKVKVAVENLDRVDLSVADRPRFSEDAAAGAGPTSIEFSGPFPPGTRIVATGYRQGRLMASARQVV